MHARETALLSQHAALERRLQEALARPAPDDFEVRRIKIAKLKVKDELEFLWRRRRRRNRRLANKEIVYA